MGNKMTRKEALKSMGLLGLSPIVPKFIQRRPKGETPNIIMILCDQFRADACKREGFELDTTPFLDSLAQDGTWFNKAYCAAPACVPSRTAMQTGRFPSATRVRTNNNVRDALYSSDLLDAVKARGYRTAVVGKTGHSYLTYHPERFDFFKSYGHMGSASNDPEIRKFNQYLHSTHFYADFKPAPFPPEMEQPYRIVSDGMDWLSSVKDQNNPFFLYLSIPEPHNPYQVSEPYYSLFPPKKLPLLKSGKSDLPAKGKKFTMQRRLEEIGYPGFEKHIPRIRSNYYGMMRLIDDQVKRLVAYLKENDLYKNTILLFLADHGDYTGEYGLIKKGAGLPDCLARIPMLWHGPGIIKNKGAHSAHVSNIDIMPTICSIVGYPIPDGVIGRSLWPLLKGKEYPKQEFTSIIAQQGFGGRDYTDIYQIDPYKDDGCVIKGKNGFNELNSYSQSGTLRLLRKDDWKLLYNMQCNGRMYNLAEDPAEVNDLFQDPKYFKKQMELLRDMMAWELRSQDPLPLPRDLGKGHYHWYIYRSDPHNYWTPYHDPDVM